MVTRAAVLAAVTLVPALAMIATSADAFVDSIGINTHLSYTDTAYKNLTLVAKARMREPVWPHPAQSLDLLSHHNSGGCAL
jgi:hypothetical protein